VLEAVSKCCLLVLWFSISALEEDCRQNVSHGLTNDQHRQTFFLSTDKSALNGTTCSCHIIMWLRSNAHLPMLLLSSNADCFSEPPQHLSLFLKFVVIRAQGCLCCHYRCCLFLNFTQIRQGHAPFRFICNICCVLSLLLLG